MKVVQTGLIISLVSGPVGMQNKPPRSVLVVRVETVFFQCARAVIRSHL